MNLSERLNDKYFIAICATGASSYCDMEFFESILAIAKGNQVYIAYGAGDEAHYGNFENIFKKSRNLHFIYVRAGKGESSIEKNATASMLVLREKFLQTKMPYFLFINNNAFVPRALLNKFERAISYLENTDPNWGVLGGLYHRGWVSSGISDLQRVQHVLSGCTVFKRQLIEKYPFTYSVENRDIFPYTSIAAANDEFNFYDGHWVDALKVESPRTRPVIVRLYK